MTLIGVPNIANDKLLRGFQGCRFLKLGDLQVTKGFHSKMVSCLMIWVLVN